MGGGPLFGTNIPGKWLGDLITEIRTGFVYTEFKPEKGDRQPGRKRGAAPVSPDGQEACAQ